MCHAPIEERLAEWEVWKASGELFTGCFIFFLPSPQPFLCAQITAMEFVIPNVCTCSKLNSNWMTNFLTTEAPLITMCKSHWLRLGYNGCKIDTDHDRVVRLGGPDDNQFAPLKWDSSCFILQPAVSPVTWPSCAGPSESVQTDSESLVLSWPHVQGSVSLSFQGNLSNLIYIISSLNILGQKGLLHTGTSSWSYEDLLFAVNFPT